MYKPLKYCQRNKVNGYGWASLFKYKLTEFSHVVQELAEGQKLQKQHALKGQKLLAQGIALGNYGRKPVAL